MRSIAVLGGTFDPPHVGHGAMALYAWMSGWDEVRVVPVGEHPFGKKGTPFEHRFEMARLAFGDMPWVVVDDREGRRGGISRTLYTLRELRSEFPDARLGLVIGEDNLSSVHQWYGWDEIEAMAEVVVVGRGASGREFSLPDVSSSDLRARIGMGEDVSGLVHRRVLEYARRQGLYSSPGPGPSWGLVGLGRVGSSIAGALARKGIPPSWVYDPDCKKFNNFNRLRDLSQAGEVDVVFLAVPDVVVADVASQVHDSLPGVPLVTFGAARPLDVVFSRVPSSVPTAMAHPLRAFADTRPPDHPIFFTLSGHQDAVDAARAVLAPISLGFLHVPSTKVTLYHALAALLANGTAFLARGVSDALGKLLGSEHGEAPALDLLHSSVEAMRRHGITAGTTGPAARGDARAIEMHRNALSDHPRLLEAYDALLELFTHASRDS